MTRGRTGVITPIAVTLMVTGGLLIGIRGARAVGRAAATREGGQQPAAGQTLVVDHQISHLAMHFANARRRHFRVIPGLG